jgi:hypothetical protein
MSDEHWESEDARSLQIFLNGDGLASLDDRGRTVSDTSFLLMFNADDEASAWTALIRDDSLTGWVQVGGNASFTIQRNEIIGVTRPGIDDGFLCTETAYDDFELEIECKVDPGLNSGIVIRGQLAPDAPQRQVGGVQVEIDSSPRAWTGSLYDQGEGSWLATVTDVPEAREAFDPTQWNRLRIVAEGPRVRTWVNGVPAVDCARVNEQAGFIGLQIHRTRVADGLEVRWRRLRIRAVSEATPTEEASDLATDTDADTDPNGDRPDKAAGQAEPEEATPEPTEDQEPSPSGRGNARGRVKTSSGDASDSTA